MFKKPFKVKSNTQLKGSDRKKLRADILQQFSNLTEADLSNIIPNKETTFQIKVICHSGDIVIIYTVQKLPVVFELEKIMYPTVYMLWHVPELLHTFTTHPQVFPIIGGGADLMLPGVVLPNGVGLHAYGKLQKGDRVAINLTSNKAPIAVGLAAHSSYDMYMSAKRGKCVEVLHYYGDLLSTFGTKLVVPHLGPAFTDGNVEEMTETSELSKPLEHNEDNKSVDSLTNGIASELHLNSEEVNGNSEGEAVAGCDTNSKEENKLQNGNGCKQSSDSLCSTESMDELLKYCFLKSLRTTVKKVELPLLTSNFYKLHMIPACPSTKNLDIKKSSFKKLSNFLDEMVKLGLITLESPQKGVQSISKVDFSNELIKTFVDSCDEDDYSRMVVDTTQTNQCSAPEITEKYTVTAAVLPLFYTYDYKKKEAVTPSVVRKVVSDYVKMKNLQVIKKEVMLDDVLRSACDAPSDVEVIGWDLLVSGVFNQMGHTFKVELKGSEVPFTKGKLQPIDIQVGTRSGNKKVTLVNNLELFGINIQEFSRECQHGVAASTTINTLPSAKSAQLQVQGNQVTFIAKLLMEKYQIPKRYLRGLENAPKKKK